MTLSGRQIERYSRQIIVPGFGGIAQQRLLTATVNLAGELADVTPALEYLVGAGVGAIVIVTADAIADREIVDDMGHLNSDSRVAVGLDAVDRHGLNLILIGGSGAIEPARRLLTKAPGCRTILARLDSPASIAALNGSPCPLCAEMDLLRGFGTGSENTGFLVMIAAAQALLTLAQAGSPESPSMLTFDGYESQRIPLRRRADIARCECERTHAE
jgi:molybdopterin/thiamine biosynthesis adenylyltransferase